MKEDKDTRETKEHTQKTQDIVSYNYKSERQGKEGSEKFQQKIEDRHAFKARNTKLESMSENTKNQMTEFRGFLNILVVVFFLYIVFNFIDKYLQTGIFVNPKIIEMLYYLPELAVTWIFFHIWTYTALFVQHLLLRNFSWFVCYLLQYIFELSIFASGIGLCLTNSKYGISHQVFILIQTCVHFFKMHSFFLTNRDYRSNLLSKGTGGADEIPVSNYPNNLTLSNFFYFLCAPTFVYQDSYPKNDKFRLWYFIQKSISGLFCVVLICFIYYDFMYIPQEKFMENTYIRNVNIAIIPVIIIELLVFYMMFECFCPAYAEMTCFADRFFYDDFWNSTDMAEFMRKWNRPVYDFLFRHVYLELIQQHGCSVKLSQFLTFFYSAILHEFFFVVIFRFCIPVFFTFYLIQIPMINYLRPLTKGKTFGNYFVWFGIIVGNPCFYVFYNTMYYKING